ncbi:MAG TPA: hypothetical protein VFS11_10290 [Gemmatimonadales bacterium]|nr:hypothetical protein [Gemmatimonadales bacterium]
MPALREIRAVWRWLRGLRRWDVRDIGWAAWANEVDTERRLR